MPLFLKERIINRVKRFAGIDVNRHRAPDEYQPPPRHIWMYWAQGWDAAPRLALQARDSWERCNPGWTVHALCNRSIGDHIPSTAIPPSHLSHAHQSDCLRYALLERHGGVWADATVICARPLDHWIDLVTCPAGFFAFSAPFPDRLLSNWFLASAPGSPVMVGWAEKTRRWLRDHGQTGHYLWSHYLFARLIEHNPAIASHWARVPKLSARGPHLAQACLGGAIDETLLAEAKTQPMHKLSLRLTAPEDRIHALVARLIQHNARHA